MISKQFLLSGILVSLFSVFSVVPRSEPVIRDGRYYNNPQDTYQHINFAGAIKHMANSVFSLQYWKAKFFSAPNTQHALFEPICTMPLPIQSIPAAECHEPTITWIGHATFLIQLGGHNILTDPIFGDIKALSDPLVGKKVFWNGITLAKRKHKPGIAIKDLPPIDVILISHDHSDHTDTESLMYLAQKYDPLVCVPVGNKALFASFGFTNIRELSWWQTVGFNNGWKELLQFTCLPAHHWSIRFSLDSYRRSLWSSWMITSQKGASDTGCDCNIYFAGDTAYTPHFKEIAQAFPSIDVALLPIGPTEHECGVHNKHAEYHVDANEAVNAFVDLQARTFVPMHYGTFGGNDHHLYPLHFLHHCWHAKGDALQGKQLLIAQCGRGYEITQQ